MDVKTVGVVGCGLMGSGIAEIFARAGATVVVVKGTKALPSWSVIVIVTGIFRSDVRAGLGTITRGSGPSMPLATTLRQDSFTHTRTVTLWLGSGRFRATITPDSPPMLEQDCVQEVLLPAATKAVSSRAPRRQDMVAA